MNCVKDIWSQIRMCVMNLCKKKTLRREKKGEPMWRVQLWQWKRVMIVVSLGSA